MLSFKDLRLEKVEGQNLKMNTDIVKGWFYQMELCCNG